VARVHLRTGSGQALTESASFQVRAHERPFMRLRDVLVMCSK
jgi:hypothetical protein